MGSKKRSKEEEKWIREHKDSYSSVPKMLVAFNQRFEKRTYKALGIKLSMMKIKVCGGGVRETSINNLKEAMKRKHDESNKNIQWLYEHKQNMTYKELAVLYAKTFGEYIEPNTLKRRLLRAGLGKEKGYHGNRERVRELLSYSDGVVRKSPSDKGAYVKYKRKWRYIPKSIYENNLIVPNCALAYISQVSLEKNCLDKNMKIGYKYKK